MGRSQLAQEVLRKLAVEELLLHHVDAELGSYRALEHVSGRFLRKASAGQTRAPAAGRLTSSLQPSVMELRSSLRMKRCRDAGASRCRRPASHPSRQTDRSL